MSWGPVLMPDGVEARLDAPMAWTLIGGSALIFLAVVWLMVRAVVGPAAAVRAGRWVIGGGLLLPLLVLGSLALANVQQLRRAFAAPMGEPAAVGVQARAWWWQVRVPGEDGAPDVLLANEIVLPVGRPSRVALGSDGVIHSLWVPALAGKLDAVPGRVQHLVLHPAREGRWLAPCAEFCGLGHARMTLEVVGLAPAAYAAWLREQQRPARPPATPLEARGQQQLVALRCTACHTVRGFAQAALAGVEGDAGGPDLTHLASRRMLGGGVVRNDAAGLRSWITDLQRLKPGARMPTYAHLDAATLDALVAYLGSLR